MSVIYLLFCIVVAISYRYIKYKFVIKYELLVSLLLVVICIVPVGLSVYKYKHDNNSSNFVDMQKAREFKSNQDSEYSQLWLDFLSYRESEVGRLGSEENFKSFLEVSGYDEKQYAKDVIAGMLEEQGIEDETIVDKCIEENMFTK